MNREVIQYGISVIALLVMELVYFQIAHRFQIVDKPNDRSSHAHAVIRGGGVVFIAGVLLWFVQSGYAWPWFVLGALLIAIISFMDDVMSLNPFLRILVQACAVLIMFAQLWPIHWPIYLLVLAVIVCIGTLNAFNFMDGINGMTGLYAFANLTTFAFINMHVVEFSNDTLILTLIIAVLIFLFFNFRKRAVCFAGDVGSVTIAFIQIFFLISLIQKTDNFFWVILFLVYGFDSVVTILYRLKNRENIFKPHRTHLYQYLSNEFHWSHRFVSILYMVVQMVLNAVLVYSFERNFYFMPIIVAFTFVVLYMLMRVNVLRKVVKLT